MDQQFNVGGGYGVGNINGAPKKKKIIIFGSVLAALIIIVVGSSLLGGDVQVEKRAEKFFSELQDGKAESSYEMLNNEAKSYTNFAVWESKVISTKGGYDTSSLKLIDSKEIEDRGVKYQKLTFDTKDKYNNNARYTAYLTAGSDKKTWMIYSYSIEVISE